VGVLKIRELTLDSYSQFRTVSTQLQTVGYSNSNNWTVSSTYESVPTFNVGELDCPPNTKLQLMRHHRVHLLLHVKHRQHRPPLKSALMVHE
jgi:hypothetical protein